MHFRQREDYYGIGRHRSMPVSVDIRRDQGAGEGEFSVWGVHARGLLSPPWQEARCSLPLESAEIDCR